jgi:hypothetical protein
MPSYFYKESQSVPFKDNRSLIGNQSSRKNMKELAHRHWVYFEKSIPSLNTTITQVFTAIKGKDFV